MKEGGVFFGFSRQNFPSAPKRWASKACSGFQRLRPSNERQARVAKLLKRRPGWLRRGRQTWHQPQPAAQGAARAGCRAACTACVEFRNENSVLTHAPMKSEKMDFEESAKKMWRAASASHPLLGKWPAGLAQGRRFSGPITRPSSRFDQLPEVSGLTPLRFCPHFEVLLSHCGTLLSGAEFCRDILPGSGSDC